MNPACPTGRASPLARAGFQPILGTHQLILGGGGAMEFSRKKIFPLRSLYVGLLKNFRKITAPYKFHSPLSLESPLMCSYMGVYLAG